MARVGARLWLAFLLCAWGAVAACFALITTPRSFYLLRALLGAFEAGAFPAMWHTLSVFFPRSRCAWLAGRADVCAHAWGLISPAGLMLSVREVDVMSRGWRRLHLLELCKNNGVSGIHVATPLHCRITKPFAFLTSEFGIH
jgi:MFS family permease